MLLNTTMAGITIWEIWEIEVVLKIAQLQKKNFRSAIQRSQVQTLRMPQPSVARSPYALSPSPVKHGDTSQSSESVSSYL